MSQTDRGSKSDEPVTIKSQKSLRTVSFPHDPSKNKENKEVDVKKLNREASTALLDYVLEQHAAEDDQSLLLEEVRKRFQVAGLAPPGVEIRYENLTVEVKTLVAHRYIPNILYPGGRSLFSKEKTSRFTRLALLAPCSGVLHPGRLTLVLGPPGSGRTTFLRALAGRAQKQSDIKVKGSVTYNGHTFDDFEPAHAAAYVSQADLHYGELTVRETVSHAAKCLGTGPSRKLLEILDEREKSLGITPDPAVDAFMKASAWGGSNTVDVERTIRLLGLAKCADTVVGNAMIRGISGGEKKRVTSAEVLVGGSKVLLGDEISTGLDSRTTHEVVKYLHHWVRALNGTAALALLQPSPETFELFDDVILLSNGIVVYSGPREGILPFFSSMGFECPARCGIAEFMQEVTTPTDQQKYWSYPEGREYEYVPSYAMSDAFQQTKYALEAKRLLEKPYEPPLGDDRLATVPLPKDKYGASYTKMWKANAMRAGKLQSRNKLFLYVRWFQVVLMSLVTGTLYIKVRNKESVDDGNLIMGALFFAMIYMLMAGSSEMHVLGERLRVFFRQREMKMYPGSAFALPAFIWRIPYCMVDAILWSAIMYFLVGLDPNVGRYFMFMFLMFLTAAWSTSLNQAIASVFHESIAQAIAMLVIMVLLVAGGFIVIKDAIPGAWKAAYYSNPWFYLTQAFAINEFTGNSWNKPYQPDDPNSISLGVAVLEFRAFETDYVWVWYGVIIVLASIAVNVAVFVLAATFRKAPAREGFITEESLAELESNRTATKILPESLKREIEMGMKRSASMARLKTIKGSQTDLNNIFNETNKAAEGIKTDASDIEIASKKFNKNKSQNASIVASSSSALPFEPLRLTFKNVSYSIAVPKSKGAPDYRIAKKGPHAGNLQLLHDITGSFRPGVLTALMGASGAGKTTLMDVLAGRKTGGKISGDIRVNGYAKQNDTFARVSAYVEQEDSHLAQCTVAEALEFSASLRLPNTVSQQVRHKFVDEVMGLVELHRLSRAMIGYLGEGTGLTIEQRKRLTIAVEMVSNPSILFMDEPTTGLDARGAAVVMSVVRATAATGRTVVCTIHQPSYAIFEAFDELIVLKPGGKCIYNGTIGAEAKDMITYFSSIPNVEPMKPQLNPANWMLEQTTPRREEELGIDFAEIYSKSAEAKKTEAIYSLECEPLAGSKPLAFEDMNTSPIKTQFWLIFRRLLTMYWRMPSYVWIRYIVTLLVIAVFGSIFYDQGEKYLDFDGPASPSSVINIAGVIFMSVLFVGATNSMTVMKVIADQRTVFYRERAAGMYQAIPFAFAQGLVEVPFILIQSIIYAFPVYFLIGFSSEAGKVGYFFFFLFLSLWYFTEYGAACVNITPELGIATLLSSFVFSFLNLFSGFMITSEAMGWWWRWFTYINPVYWTLYGLLASQLGDVQKLVDNFGNGDITIEEFMKERFGYHYSMVGPIIAILIAFVILFRGLSVWALVRLNFQKR